MEREIALSFEEIYGKESKNIDVNKTLLDKEPDCFQFIKRMIETFFNE